MALKASPHDQALLLDLQALDTKIAQLQYRSKNLPQHAAIAELAKSIAALRITELEQRGIQEDIAVELSRLESDVVVVQARITRDTERMQSSTSSKDALAFEHELGLLAKRQFDLEEIQITVMEKLEEREAELEVTREKISTIGAEADVLAAQRDAELATIDAEIMHSTANRSTIAGTVPTDLLALYEKQRSRYGTGASLLQHGVSKASGVKLLENEMQAIRAAAPDDVIMCASSEGILVRTAESGI
jgi:predicted  nucleic acid-binding Zn-ribbon protein